jgi:hypothetical protein
VRLLRLLPYSDEHPGIRCQLFTCKLLDSESIHPYEALSYVWGPEGNKQSICIDSSGHKHELFVRANLHAALSRLRDRFIDRIIWTAICINQDDDEEKGQQVQSMARIYAKANRVIVWLGEAADNSDRALKAIRRVAEQQHTSSAIYTGNQEEAAPALPDQQPTDSTVEETDQQAILKLLERSWFERIWVSGRNQLYGQNLFTW